MTLEVLSPEHMLFAGEVERVTLPGELGTFTVLAHHAPIISSLVKGEVRYKQSGHDEAIIAIKSGFVEVLHDKVSVCIEQA